MTNKVLHKTDFFEVGVVEETNKYYLLNLSTNIYERKDIDHYVEALFLAENFNHALKNHTYRMDDVQLNPLLNLLTADMTPQ